MSSVHSAAQQGFSAETQCYVRGRPEYPGAFSDWPRDALGPRPQTVTVDLGADTGKFAHLLARTDARVIMVKPMDAIHTQLAEASLQIQALTGNAQSIPLANGFADTLVCAQALHWFATVETLEETRRVLTAEDGLGLVRNVHDESLDWVIEITRIITPYEGDVPRFCKGDWRRPFEHVPFGPLRLSTFAYEHTGPPGQMIISRFLSMNPIAASPETEKNTTAAQLRELVASHPALKGKGQVALPHRTEAYLAGARQAHCPVMQPKAQAHWRLKPPR